MKIQDYDYLNDKLEVDDVVYDVVGTGALAMVDWHEHNAYDVLSFIPEVKGVEFYAMCDYVAEQVFKERADAIGDY